MLYVSHRLEEVFQISDRVTVMRNGRLVWTRDRAGLTIADDDHERLVFIELPLLKVWSDELPPHPAVAARVAHYRQVIAPQIGAPLGRYLAVMLTLCAVIGLILIGYARAQMSTRNLAPTRAATQMREAIRTAKEQMR